MGKCTLVGRSMKKDDEGGLILTEKYNLSQAPGICGISEAEALVCGKSTTESLRSLLFSGGKSLTEKYSFWCTKKEYFASFVAQDKGCAIAAWALPRQSVIETWRWDAPSVTLRAPPYSCGSQNRFSAWSAERFWPLRHPHLALSRTASTSVTMP